MPSMPCWSLSPANGPLKLLASHSHPIPEPTKHAIHSLTLPGPDEIDRLGALHTELGELFSGAALAVLREGKLTAKDVRAIGSHGQTVRHRPAGKFPFSLQIGNPSVIAERTGITTVADFRARDIAARRLRGAPLVPAFHQYLFHARGHHRAIVNIGGIANITYLPADHAQPVLGFDTGPGNTCSMPGRGGISGKAHDEAGQWAAGGRPCRRVAGKNCSPILASPPHRRKAPGANIFILTGSRRISRPAFVRRMYRQRWRNSRPAASPTRSSFRAGVQ